jgi:protein phosphatase
VTGFGPIDFSSLTDVGIRRSHNQDAHTIILAGDYPRWCEQGHVFMVADGMGGHAVGEKASAKAIRDIPHTYLKYARTGVAAAMRRAFVETNAGIFTIGQRNPEFKGMGTTATMLVLKPEGAWVAHVGDSRVYRVRQGRIEQLTFDHSYIWEMARRQNVDPSELHGLRSNVIIRSLGPDAMVQVDIEGPHPVEIGDVFVLCSDGLSGPVSDAEIGAVASALPAEEACRFLVALANLRGGPDNITVQIVRIEQPTADLAKSRQPLWRRIPWSLPVLLIGLTMVIGAIGLTTIDRWAGGVLFLMAAGTVATGVVGLFQRARHERSQQIEEPPPNINFYRSAECGIDRAAIDRLVAANAELLAKLREATPNANPDGFATHVEQAEAFLAGNNLEAAFGEYCRAMHVLAQAVTVPRDRPETFQPVWDRHTIR